MFSSDVQFYDLKDITFSENKVSIVSSTETLNIVKNSEELSFYDTSGNILNINQKNKNDEITITFEEEGYKDYSIILKKNLLTLKQKNTSVDFVILDDGIGLIGNSNKLVNQIEKAPSIGFEGKERLGPKEAIYIP